MGNGIVAFTNSDTKITINSGMMAMKKSRIASELNFSVLLNFALLFVLCLIAGVMNGVYYNKYMSSSELLEFGAISKLPAGNGIVSFFVAVILYQSLVSISFYISIEIIKTPQALFIYLDILMYYERLDYSCTPKTWNISDDLGQIE